MSVPGVIPEKKMIELVDSVHLRFMDELEVRILALLEFGYSVPEIAAGLAKSEATVNRHIREIKERLFDELGIEPSTTRLNHWTRRHFPCCTREAKEMIENCQILSVGGH